MSTAPEVLASYDEPTLESAFERLSLEVQTGAALLNSAEAIEAFRLHWLSRKGGRLKLVSDLWLKSAPAEARKPLGMRFNQLKQEIERALEAPVGEPDINGVRTSAGLDLSLPGLVRRPGVPHPLIETLQAVVKVFENLGYSVSLGPQVETDFYNFEALNFPPNHPARDTQDTLLIANQGDKASRDRLLMRTHTSPVQIRTMVASDPPLRIVIPGKVHRNDAADATHSPIFHQIEGLAVGPDITFSDLKGTLDHAMKALFGADVRTRFFPSFFPFTEPSADVQISCIFCGGAWDAGSASTPDGLSCLGAGWWILLYLQQLRTSANGRDEIRRRMIRGGVSGFAFGMGVERIAMIRHGVADIGQFYSGDMRFLEQFA